MDRLEEKVMNIYRAAVKELDSFKDRDPAAVSRLEVAFLYPGFHALIAYRAAHFLHVRGYIIPARVISQSARLLTGIEIHPGAKIGKGLFIDHGAGVVIGETSEIGDNCTFYQGVTLGGTGKDVGKRHPTVGNDVMIGAGAKVLGPITVGNNCKIAANAVVLSSIPDNCTAVGIPAHVVRRDNVRVDECDLDQIHIPDPVSQELCALRERVSELEEKLTKIMEGIDSK
ncbi:MAG: serine O-acetyltransferase [Clostridia bacterium]|nr:serine O-acetyltransferase [Clostridia bacterium]